MVRTMHAVHQAMQEHQEERAGAAARAARMLPGSIDDAEAPIVYKPDDKAIVVIEDMAKDLEYPDLVNIVKQYLLVPCGVETVEDLRELIMGEVHERLTSPANANLGVGFVNKFAKKIFPQGVSCALQPHPICDLEPEPNV